MRAVGHRAPRAGIGKHAAHRRACALAHVESKHHHAPIIRVVEAERAWRREEAVEGVGLWHSDCFKKPRFLQQRHDVSKTTFVTFSMQSPAPLRPKSSPSYLRRGLRSASPPKRVSAPRAGHLARRLSASHTNLVSKDMVRRLSQGMIKAPSIGGNDGGHSWSSAAWRHAERRASEQGLPACVPRRPTTCRNVASAAYFGHFL